MAERIPQSFIDELLARLDIAEIVGARVSLRETGGNHKGLCPFHQEKTPSFTVNRDKQFYYCFGCGAHGTAISFLMEHDNMGFLDAIQELAAAAGMEVPKETGAMATAQQHAPLYQVLEKAVGYYTSQLRSHADAQRAVAYLKERGLSGTIAAQYEVGLAPEGWRNLLNNLEKQGVSTRTLVAAGLVVEKDGKHYDRFRDRIMFPIRDQRGRAIGFGGRVLGEGEPKYLNSPETGLFQKGRELYGANKLAKGSNKPERLLVVEGYMDVLALAQFGLTNAVATLGTATTRDHLNRLFRLTSEVVFCFDGDRAGKQAAWRALQTTLPEMREGRSASFIFLPEGEDPDSLVRKHGRAPFEQQDRITPLSKFLFDDLLEQADPSTLDGRARLLDLAKPLVSKIPAGAYRTLITQELAGLAHLDEDKVLPVLLEQRSGRSTQRPARAGTPQSPSLLRKTITLLLQEPSLALGVQRPSLALLQGEDRPGFPLLVELLKIIQQRPDIQIGAIVERFRGSVDGSHLGKLIAMEPLGTTTVVKSDFQGAIQRLCDDVQSRRRMMLAKKGRLTEAEKAELQRRG